VNELTPEQKLWLAKMLPEKVTFDESFSPRDCEPRLRWLYDSLQHVFRQDLTVLDTELLHLCWLVEEYLGDLWIEYHTRLIEQMPPGERVLSMTYHATWQQRALALCKVKGVEVV